MIVKPDMSFDSKMTLNSKEYQEMRKGLLRLGFPIRKVDGFLRRLQSLNEGEVLHFRSGKILVEKK